MILMYIFGLVILYFLVLGIHDSIKQRIRDKAAKEVLVGFDYKREKEEIISICANFVPEELLCPKCNGLMRTKKGAYGEFIGCSNYPNCRYTRSVK
ncbi:topoisomerase DNA-binding C4 zinc finger domain-containing protein [Flagellimonas lutimaris]|uniref:topoisomerase DNA-binding C4 zinc finger domain-containing protein n=1 Tax=Flagellimonas lutimaris TaxID=475082 RepID=UPI003F5CD243